MIQSLHGKGLGMERARPVRAAKRSVRLGFGDVVTGSCLCQRIELCMRRERKRILRSSQFRRTPRRSFQGPSHPNAVKLAYTIPGRAFATSSTPNPLLGNPPGRYDWRNTSASFTREANVSLSAGSFRSSWVVRFPREVSTSRFGSAGSLGDVTHKTSAPCPMMQRKQTLLPT